MPVKVYIKVQPPEGDAKFYPISNEPITLGRTSASRISINDDQLSGVHMRFYVQGKSVFIEDLDSKNGTSLNNIKIYQQRFCVGDQILAGGTTIEIAGPDKNSEEILNLLNRNGTGITLNLQSKEETSRRYGGNDAAVKFTRNAKLYHGDRKSLKKKSKVKAVNNSLKEVLALLIDISLSIGVFAFALKIAPKFYPDPFKSNTNKAISAYFSVELLPVTVACLVLALIVFKLNRGNGEKASIGEKLTGLD